MEFRLSTSWSTIRSARECHAILGLMRSVKMIRWDILEDTEFVGSSAVGRICIDASAKAEILRHGAPKSSSQRVWVVCACSVTPERDGASMNALVRISYTSHNEPQRIVLCTFLHRW